ncbi:TBC1 domain family member 14 [Phyllostomus discolor]|uniref:TBC1 domain family member 14 n=1 Tax=Phyllostomus discolor TaxID=89673 RepID=A0A834F0H7_9CHIR|nr:TBC1 domain family member 14 [Phyllostomus discolor]
MPGFQRRTEKLAWSSLNWTFLGHSLTSASSSKAARTTTRCTVFWALTLVTDRMWAMSRACPSSPQC